MKHVIVLIITLFIQGCAGGIRVPALCIAQQTPTGVNFQCDNGEVIQANNGDEFEYNDGWVFKK